MKYLRIIILALAVILFTGERAYATPIPSPTSYAISAVTAYSPTMEPNDKEYIISFSIQYGVIPSTDAGQAWLIRLFDSGVEVASTTPYAFYNSGYAIGVASIYLPASIATGLSANISLSIEPNPTLTWVSIPSPAYFTSIINSSAATLADVSTAIATQVTALAIGLNIPYGSTNPMIEQTNGLWKFTARGESYFDVTIPILRTICGILYSSGITRPILVDNNYDSNYQQQVDSQLIGTPFDATDLAADWGISRMWATGALWFGFCMLCSGLVGWKIQTAKPVFFIFGGLMIAGGFMGFGLLQSVLFGLLGAASIVLAFAWRGA